MARGFRGGVGAREWGGLMTGFVWKLLAEPESPWRCKGSFDCVE
jgi:hypothetical protein